MIISNQRGNPTYRYTIFRAIFGGYEYLNKILDEIIIEAQSNVERGFQSWSIIQMPKTELGDSAIARIKDSDPGLEYEVGLFHDGWRIKLLIYGLYPSEELRKQIFGKTSLNYVWTQETEKVSSLISKLAQEARKA